MGTSLNPYQIIGETPDLRQNSPVDAGAGRLIPSTSHDQLAATLATWMGVSRNDLQWVSPYIDRFGRDPLAFI